MGEIELEIGHYAAADSHFSAIRYDGAQFTVGARLARWRELSGHSDRARRLLAGAAANADRRDDLPREQVAWFHYRLGELELRVGRLAAADSALRRGLAIFPADYRILGALARVAAARERWTESIAYGDRAIAIQLDPTTLGTISDAWTALGDSARAAEYARAMTVNALHQPGRSIARGECSCSTTGPRPTLGACSPRHAPSVASATMCTATTCSPGRCTGWTSPRSAHLQ
jgi:tetratricopeptide (TPR) repeat protein